MMKAGSTENRMVLIKEQKGDNMRKLDISVSIVITLGCQENDLPPVVIPLPKSLLHLE
jgi:hypothetical protein